MPRSSFGTREPKTKADFISRMMSFDFNGDIRSLFPAGCVLTRTGTNSIAVTSLATSKKWVLKVSLPRKEETQSIPDAATISASPRASHQAPQGVQSGREKSSAPAGRKGAKRRGRK